MNENRPIVTVGGLIINPSGQVLMIRTHKWSNLWGIPGGKTEFGESSEAALLREIKEETNLDVADVRFVLVQDCIQSPEFHRNAHFVLLNYTCHCHQDAVVKLNDEAEEFRWVTIPEALAMPINSPTRKLLEVVAGKTSPQLQLMNLSKITISDLELHYHIGVGDEERSKPQLILMTVEMMSDFSSAIATDQIAATVDYFQVCERLKGFGNNRSWKLIEKLANDACEMILAEFGPAVVTVTVKKFVIPKAEFVAVTHTVQRNPALTPALSH